MNNPDPAAPSDGGLRTAFPATLLLALAALAAVAPLATDAYLPAFGQMADDLGVSASSVQLTMTTFLVGIALGQLGIGVLSDRFGRRPLLLWGSVLALAASICSALAPSLPFLLVARFFQGLGGAAGMVLGRAVISDRSSVLDEGMLAGCVGIVWDSHGRPDTDHYRARHEAVGAVCADTSEQVYQAVEDVVSGRVVAPEDLILLDAGACARLTALLRRDVI